MILKIIVALKVFLLILVTIQTAEDFIQPKPSQIDLINKNSDTSIITNHRHDEGAGVWTDNSAIQQVYLQ